MKTKKRMPKERCIYNNYELQKTYPDEEIKEIFLENGVDEENITDDMIWEERYRENELDFEIAYSELKNYFDKNTSNSLMLFGQVGRWNGVYKAGKLFDDFENLFYSATKDCDYVHIYDENGHLYIHCSHHDGSCSFEIKEITDKGYEYLWNWEQNWSDERTEEYVHTQIFNRYSKIPHFAHKVYGCKKREYEEINKENLINKINKQAKSFYA